MFVKIKENIHYNLNNVSSVKFFKEYNDFCIRLFLNCCNDEGHIAYETFYFKDEKEYRKTRSRLFEYLKP